MSVEALPCTPPFASILVRRVEGTAPVFSRETELQIPDKIMDAALDHIAEVKLPFPRGDVTVNLLNLNRIPPDRWVKDSPPLLHQLISYGEVNADLEPIGLVAKIMALERNKIKGRKSVIRLVIGDGPVTPETEMAIAGAVIPSFDATDGKVTGASVITQDGLWYVGKDGQVVPFDTYEKQKDWAERVKRDLEGASKYAPAYTSDRFRAAFDSF